MDMRSQRWTSASLLFITVLKWRLWVLVYSSQLALCIETLLRWNVDERSTPSHENAPRLHTIYILYIKYGYAYQYTLSYNAYMPNRGISPMRLPQFYLFLSFLNILPLVWTILLSIIGFFVTFLLKILARSLNMRQNYAPLSRISLELIISFFISHEILFTELPPAPGSAVTSAPCLGVTSLR